MHPNDPMHGSENSTYHLIICYIAMENGPFIDGLPRFTYWKLWFSMAMLNNQRVVRLQSSIFNIHHKSVKNHHHPLSLYSLFFTSNHYWSHYMHYNTSRSRGTIDYWWYYDYSYSIFLLAHQYSASNSIPSLCYIPYQSLLITIKFN